MISYNEKQCKRAVRHTSKYGTPIEHVCARMALAFKQGKGVMIHGEELNRLMADHAIYEMVNNEMECILNEAESFGGIP